MPAKIHGNILTDKGLYARDGVWWLRTVRSPLTHKRRACSTGTDDRAQANRIRAYVRELRANTEQWELLDRIATGGVSLKQAYDAYQFENSVAMRAPSQVQRPTVIGSHAPADAETSRKTRALDEGSKKGYALRIVGLIAELESADRLAILKHAIKISQL